MWTNKILQTTLVQLTYTMLSITGVTWGTVLGTCEAANGVLARESMATTSVVCCTFIDIYEITTKAKILFRKLCSG